MTLSFAQRSRAKRAERHLSIRRLWDSRLFTQPRIADRRDAVSGKTTARRSCTVGPPAANILFPIAPVSGYTMLAAGTADQGGSQVFNQHPVIPFPRNENAAIWRFTDVAGFVDFLESSTLHFTRLDALNDPLEGHGTAMDLVKEWLPEQLFRVAGSVSGGGDQLDRWRAEKMRDEERRKAVEMVRRLDLQDTCWVHCWHASLNENVLLWKAYARAGKIVAMRSTVGALREALGPETDFHVSIALVDYSATQAGWPSLTGPRRAITKSKYFENEHELRAVLTPCPDRHSDLSTGFKVPVDKNRLVEEVLIAPGVAGWIGDLTVRMMAHFDLDLPCRRSTLYAQPEYLLPFE